MSFSTKLKKNQKKRHKWDVLLKKSDIINYKYLYSNA